MGYCGAFGGLAGWEGQLGGGEVFLGEEVLFEGGGMFSTPLKMVLYRFK